MLPAATEAAAAIDPVRVFDRTRNRFVDGAGNWSDRSCASLRTCNGFVRVEVEAVRRTDVRASDFPVSDFPASVLPASVVLADAAGLIDGRRILRRTGAK